MSTTILSVAAEMPLGSRASLPLRSKAKMRSISRCPGACATASRFDVPTEKGFVRLVEQAARRFPERIRRAAMLAMLAPKSADCPQGRWLMGEVRRHDTMALLDAIAEAAKFNSGSWLSDSTCPSAVIVTQDDMVVSVEAQRELARVLGRPTVYEIPGDHFVCIKRPREFNEALVAACAGVQG